MAKHPNFPFCAALLVLTAALGSCAKDEENAPPDTPGGGSGNNTTAGITPSYADADAVLAAVRVNTTQSIPLGSIDVVIGGATAVFSTDGLSTLLNVGTVTCNGDALDALGNQAYAYAPTATAPTGIDLTASNSVTWVVEGGNGFAGFERTLSGPFPAAGSITSGGTVVRANGYTLTSGAMLGADSVLFTVGPVVRVVPGNATSHTFSAQDLASLNPGSATAQVVGYNGSSEDIGGRRVYFVKQSAQARSVTIQ
jgi:hypothetical protein